MTEKDYTHLVLVVDRSGSMGTIAKDMNGGIKALLKEQAKEPGKIRIDAYTFDDTVERIAIQAHPTDRVLSSLVRPRGSTALYDAVGKAVTEVGEMFAGWDEAERPEHVVVVIVTDGEENASREWKAPAVKALVQQQTDEYGWRFVFLGANIDAFAVGHDFGIPQASTMNYAPSTAGASNVFASTSGYLRSARGAAAGQSISFSDEDRAEAMEGTDA